MFKRILLLTLLLLTTFCSICMAGRIYVDRDYHYSIQLPDGFKIVHPKEGCIMSAEDSKGATVDVTVEPSTPQEVKAEHSKTAFRELCGTYLNNFDKMNMQIYNEYTVNINPKHFGYYLEGAIKDKHDMGISKNAYVKFIYQGQTYTVTLVSPYDSDLYLRKFSLFRQSINLVK